MPSGSSRGLKSGVIAPCADEPKVRYVTLMRHNTEKMPDLPLVNHILGKVEAGQGRVVHPFKVFFFMVLLPGCSWP